jgi:hypothetical protein
MTTVQLPLVDEPGVNIEAWAAFLAEWRKGERTKNLAHVEPEPVLCKQIGARWCVVARVQGRERVASHRNTIEECAASILAGRRR